MCRVVCAFGGGHRVQVVRSYSLSLGVFRPFCPRLCPLSCFACRVACEYGFISRFKGVLAGFGVRMYVCMGLGLCVDYGAFVCVRCLAVLWLVACLPLFCPLLSSSCPFALVFAFLFTSLLQLSLFVLLSSACPLSLCGLLLFLFPLRTIRKKKGRAVLVRPLLSCCGLWACYAKYGFPFS